MTKHQKEFTIIFILLFSLIAGSIYFYFSSQIVSTKETENNSTPIVCEETNREVYGTSVTGDNELKTLKDKCRLDGGVFNECGSPCKNPTEACASVCAFTCEDIPKECSE